MDRLLRVLSVSEQGLAQMTKSDKACCLMEWNDDRRSSFLEIRNMLLSARLRVSTAYLSHESWSLARQRARQFRRPAATRLLPERQIPASRDPRPRSHGMEDHFSVPVGRALQELRTQKIGFTAGLRV
jgi:hypothetical protein